MMLVGEDSQGRGIFTDLVQKAMHLIDQALDLHQLFMNGPSYRPNNRPGQRGTTTAREASQ